MQDYYDANEILSVKSSHSFDYFTLWFENLLLRT